MHESLGFAHFWAQADDLIRAVAILLLVLSIGSWHIILGKLTGYLRARRSLARAIDAFWQADSQSAALAAIRAADRSGLGARLAADTLGLAQAYRQTAGSGIGTGVAAGEFIGRGLRLSLLMAQARLEWGLTFLASVGATAPFIGLFGTVWGIHRALIGLTGASQVTLDRIAGPLGEALVMTAAGLFVAIPAVLAYNALLRSNRLLLARLDGFANGLHAYLVAGVRLGEPSPEAADATWRSAPQVGG